ncbi:similar to Saccharomyces cerevisiae YDR352W Putative protein of unknown function [Maudiozyma barnettii]|uniref:Uncharacterized protein n=1 Tax=Maudiozyma barnettii TaxID=61262 RepID=A0A8H2VDY9_9SACH|nr:Ypq2p [Kazachstania barnettii]CAB4253771.1 similar to Saccharomyces cerevisiae YDR352W Putative protein of unknown function [Kazachstania barnettii]CAD1781520.1 similar to Saccharomyces cerevisiae YDR352W Putative protein of unknown function [Kazachstania barnettii]
MLSYTFVQKFGEVMSLKNGNVTQCTQSHWPLVSEISGSISFFGSFVSLFPQIIETYKDKSVAGLSPLFLLCWLCGDITSLAGALMTHQLMFQVVLALYFLLNDSFVCGQYYYYGILYKNTLATVGHEPGPVLSHLPHAIENNGTGVTTDNLESLIDNTTLPEGNMGDIERTTSRGTRGSNRSRRNLLIAAVSIANQVQSANASKVHTTTNNPGSGIVLSWFGAFFYVGARIPQLIKNYRRKSTDGLSPLLFATTLLCNITYCLSIFTSCRFIDSTDKWAFFDNALPFIIGSAGTVVFDLIYFYQYYVLYSTDTKLRAIERDIYNEESYEDDNVEDGEDTPLLRT